MRTVGKPGRLERDEASHELSAHGLAVKGDDRLPTLFFEIESEQLGKIPFIFDYHDFHEYTNLF